MAFFNKTEHKKIFTDEELEAEKTQLLNDITLLGKKISEAHEDHLKVSTDLQSKKKELNDIEEKITGHASILEKHENELSEIQAKIPDMQELLNDGLELKDTIKNRRTELESIMLSTEQAKSDKENHISSIVDLKIQHEAILKKKDDAWIELENLQKKHSNAIESFDNKKGEYEKIISNLEDKATNLDHEIDLRSGLLSEHARLIKESENTAQGLRNKISFLIEEIEKRKNEAEIDIHNRYNELNAMEQSMQSREGAASFKESIIKGKTKRLAEIKLELEQHLGRSIPVIIPQEDAL